MNFKVIFLFSLFTLFIGTNSYGQDSESKKVTDSSSTWQLLKYDFNNVTKGVSHSLTRPIHWKGKDYMKFGGLVVGTLILSAADSDVNRFVENQRDDFPEVIRDFGWYFGSPQNYFMANAGLYGFGLLTKNEKIRYTSTLIIASSITSGLIQTITKNAIGRARPSANIGHLEFDPFSKEGRFHSFPSGHTVLSITMAHAIAKQFDNTWAKIGIYTVGAIPPISRLIDNEHWLTDIAFSAALSIIVVDSIDKVLNKNYNTKRTKEKKVSWNFSFSTNTVGLIGTF